MRRRTFIGAIVGAAAPLAVTACNDVSSTLSTPEQLPAPRYAQTADWAPLQADELFVSLTNNNNSLQARNPGGGALWTYGQNADELNGVTDVVWHDASIAVVDSGNRRIVRLSPDGQVINAWADERFERLHSAVSLGGALYVTDTVAHCVWRVNGDGRAERLFGELGGSEGALNGPRGLALTAGGQLVIADGGNRRVVVHESTGAFVREFSRQGIESPRHIVVDRTDTVHVSDAVSGRVWAFSVDGRELGEHVPSHASSTTPTIGGIALNGAGDIVVTLRG